MDAVCARRVLFGADRAERRGTVLLVAARRVRQIVRALVVAVLLVHQLHIPTTQEGGQHHSPVLRRQRRRHVQRSDSRHHRRKQQHFRTIRQQQQYVPFAQLKCTTHPNS